MASDNGDHGENGPDKVRRLEDRLRRLDEELNQKVKRDEASAEATSAERRRRSSALGKAFRLSTELVAGVFGGGVIGWLLDRALGTLPIFLVIFLLLGIAAGLLNAVREARNMSEK